MCLENLLDLVQEMAFCHSEGIWSVRRFYCHVFLTFKLIRKVVVRDFFQTATVTSCLAILDERYNSRGGIERHGKWLRWESCASCASYGMLSVSPKYGPRLLIDVNHAGYCVEVMIKVNS